MRLRALQWLNALVSSFWLLPAVLVTAGVLLALGLVRLDERPSVEWVAALPWVFSGGADGARGLLSSIASTIVTVTGVTFSITVVALTLAAQQYTPRLLREFTADRGNQVVLGTFLATFVYSLLVLRSIRAEEYGGFVPHLAVTGAVGLALLSVGLLVYFINHITTSLRPDTILGALTRRGHCLIDRLFPGELGEDRPDETGSDEPEAGVAGGEGAHVHASGTGYVQAVDLEHLMQVAQEGGLLIRMEVGVGDFVTRGCRVLTVWPPDRATAYDGALHGCLALGPARTLDQDLEFAVLQIVDIAVKALSPGINDPTTAKTCLDYLGALLQHLGRRHIPTWNRSAPDGTVRVLASGPDFQGVVDLAFADIRRYAAGDPRVTLHLLRTLGRLDGGVSSPARRRILREQVRRVITGAEAAITHPTDLEDVREFARATFGAAVLTTTSDGCHAPPVQRSGHWGEPPQGSSRCAGP